VKVSPRVRALLQYLAAGAGGFLLAYLVVASFVLPDEVMASDVTVPSVVGLTQADAQRRLVSTGLKATLGEERFSADAPKSTVLSQTPLAGSAVSRGATVRLDVSAGQQRSAIPSLIGLTRANARQTLEKAGLQLGTISEAPSDSARGLVLEASPSEGQVVPMGTRVDLVISAGPHELTMPDLTGRDYESAVAFIDQLGLRAGTPVYEPASSFPRGTVVSQTPAAGSAVAAGTTVTLRVAGAP